MIEVRKESWCGTACIEKSVVASMGAWHLVPKDSSEQQFQFCTKDMEM